jgi:cystathionine beta-lyase
MTDPRDLPDPPELRRRGSLKWTGLSADIAAWVAESDLGVAPAITSAVHSALDAGLTGYLPPAARRELADACARWQSDRYGWAVDPARVLPVGHVTEAFQIAVDRFSRPGSPVIVPTPAYMPFLTAPAVWGRQVIQVPMTSDAGRTVLDLDRLEHAFRAGGHLLALVNPHNPTGRVMTRTELMALAEVVERHGGRVFADEVHAPLVHPGGQHVPYAALSPSTAAHTVTATSASKAWNIPGLKCAQVVLSNDADAAAWAPDDVLLTEGASTLGAIANTAAYTDGREWLADTLSYLDGNRRILADVLADVAPQIGYRVPEGTYLAWLDLRAALAARADAARSDDDAPPPWGSSPIGAVGRWLLRHSGVAVTDGGLCGEAGRGFARLNLAMPRPLVAEAARRIADCLR